MHKLVPPLSQVFQCRAPPGGDTSRQLPGPLHQRQVPGVRLRLGGEDALQTAAHEAAQSCS